MGLRFRVFDGAVHIEAATCILSVAGDLTKGVPPEQELHGLHLQAITFTLNY